MKPKQRTHPLRRSYGIFIGLEVLNAALVRGRPLVVIALCLLLIWLAWVCLSPMTARGWRFHAKQPKEGAKQE